MLGQVVPGEQARAVVVAREVRTGDRDELAAAQVGGGRGGPVEQRGPPGTDERRRDEDGHVLAGRGQGPELADRPVVARDEPADQCVGAVGCGHGGTLPRAADDPLTVPLTAVASYAPGVLTVAVLGRVEVRRDGEVLPVPGGLTSALLVRLALDAGAPVRTERLVAELWPHDPAARPNTLQVKASQLRRALGDPALLVGDTAGYTLVVEPDAVDAAVAERLAATGSALLAAGDAAGAARACAAGLALFGPEVLPGAGEWAAPHRARLEETRARLAEDGLAARLAQGEAGELVGELETLIAANPLRERLWTLLVRALYRAGRQSDALAAHRRVTRLLADELGVDPGPELAAVARDVLAHDPSLDPVPRPRGNLPALMSPLVGRADDLAGLAADLAGQRLVTLVGPAGVGKTRLAVEAARAAGGAWLVRLDGVRTADGVAAALADVVPGVDAADPAAGVRGAGHLLLLDTCEHLVDDVAALVADLLAAAPRIRVLATSRRRLGLDGEHVRPVEPLPEPDAVALFRARAARPGDDPAPVDALCRALDRLPLALELAAARTRVLTVPEIVARLDDRFALLTDPAARGRSLDAALAWSYDLLFPDDQRGLWALARFPDGAGPDAAAHVLAALGVPAAATLDVVDRLVERSLATVGTDRTGASRYRLLDSVRLFATARAADAGQDRTAAAAMTTWVAGFAADVDARVRGPGQAGCVGAVATERATVDAALLHARTHDPVTGLGIVADLGWAWVLLDDTAPAARLRAARLAAPDAPAGLRDRALLLEAWHEAMSGDLRAARTALDAAGPGTVDADRVAGFVLFQQNDPVASLQALRRSRSAAADRGLAWEEGAAALLAAFSHVALGDVAAARTACEEAIGIVGPLGDAWGLAHAEAALGRIAHAEHRFADAAGHHERAAESAARLGASGAAALHRVHLGRARLDGGDPAAADTLRHAVAEADQAGDLRLLAVARTALAEALAAAGDRDGALALLAPVQAFYAEAGGGEGADDAARVLATLTRDAPHPAAAQLPDER